MQLFCGTNVCEKQLLRVMCGKYELEKSRKESGLGATGCLPSSQGDCTN